MDFEERAIGEVTSSEKALGSGSGSGSGCAARMILKGLSPYWIRRSSATLNDVELQGLFLLTAPNMSGKSTLMRSVLVAALLANCGLFVPCSEAQVPRYDHFFLRTASHDVPIEKKSAFALEMDDVRIILKDATSRSLIMIDELGMAQSRRSSNICYISAFDYTKLLMKKPIILNFSMECLQVKGPRHGTGLPWLEPS